MTSFVPPVRARRRTATLALVLCAGLTAALTACADEDPDKGTNGIGKLTAPEIEKKAQTSAESADAVRLAGTLVSKGGTYKIDMKLKDKGGVGSVTSKNSTFELLRIGDELYLKADAGFWNHDEQGEPDADKGGQAGGAAADKLDDKYVKVPEDDPTYKQLRGFTDKKVLLGGLLTLHGTVGKGDRDKVGGVRTIRILGGKGEGGALDVSLEGTPYPLSFARGGGGGVITLADWGKDFALAAPAADDTVDYGKQLPKSTS
ncbi:MULTISPECIES: hypothetical protein [unclassified Streptomyces]|uniref:hypothetical protein n=1 Tax=unclassified Streptomyces TaxID=2593676 RepID=UPI00224CEAB0|nr:MULTISPECIES: hypothetical protein [unclassified Streptomyces]MCX5142718.1 hypothetical protein [Streptomyces sp. NBC_00338]WRZ67155.1 hypothetical protein OG408_26160 [Streptomyces sp. NBC_01257]WSU61168.1 hypothetical protein OG450_26455 [Streptomyces sp. NBC_01104]